MHHRIGRLILWIIFESNSSGIDYRVEEQPIGRTARMPEPWLEASLVWERDFGRVLLVLLALLPSPPSSITTCDIDKQPFSPQILGANIGFEAFARDETQFVALDEATERLNQLSRILLLLIDRWMYSLEWIRVIYLLMNLNWRGLWLKCILLREEFDWNMLQINYSSPTWILSMNFIRNSPSDLSDIHPSDWMTKVTWTKC